jgi:hypothetical protein
MTGQKTDLIKFQFTGSKELYSRVKNIAKIRGVTMSYLLARLASDELTKDKAFDFPAMELPEAEKGDIMYTDEVGKILTYMSKIGYAMPLEIWYVLRHDIGIKEGEIFLCAFAEGVVNGHIHEAQNARLDKHNGMKLYRLKREKGHATKGRVKSKAKKYAEYLKLKEEFGDE